MSEISQLDDQIAEAFGRLRSALAERAAGAKAALDAASAANPEEPELRARIAELEALNAELAEELEQLRVKRDKDVAALDDLIAQLKPLIEEV
ncbi:hypothetical protein [Amaricoccus sp.]|uniref:hypothetical protein n=1 Tax=Amaricoccus sp. TaxID=1872485 RepID=UPI00261110D0|nr:hypothetical protein [uncultured Amaricoccus sp.]